MRESQKEKERRVELFHVLIRIEDNTKPKTKRIRMRNEGIYAIIDYAEEHLEISKEELIRAVAEAFQVLHGRCGYNGPIEALKYREGIIFGIKCAKLAIEIIGADANYRVRKNIRPYDSIYHVKD